MLRYKSRGFFSVYLASEVQMRSNAPIPKSFRFYQIETVDTGHRACKLLMYQSCVLTCPARQGGSLRNCFSCPSPLQCLPPFLGVGCVQFRKRSWKPLSQVLLQEFQALQSDQPPSTFSSVTLHHPFPFLLEFGALWIASVHFPLKGARSRPFLIHKLGHKTRK